MKIASVAIYEYELAFASGSFTFSKGRVQASQPALVCRIETDCGIVGWGETSPFGRRHTTAFYEGERVALTLLADAVTGLDPRQSAVVQHRMGDVLLAGQAAKCAIDMACWDIAGKACDLPLFALLGGRLCDEFPVWDSLGIASPEENLAQIRAARSAGVTHFQVKVGGTPMADAQRVRALAEMLDDGCVLVVDANGGWTLQQALQALPVLGALPVFLEQPCMTLADCGEIARRTHLPLIIDEPVSGLEALVDIRERVGAGGVSIKPSRLGGIGPARQLRDAACALGFTTTIDDCWGGALTTAALSHLAASTPPENMMATTFFSELCAPMIAQGPRRNSEGRGSAPSGPGLGVEVDTSKLKLAATFGQAAANPSRAS